MSEQRPVVVEIGSHPVLVTLSYPLLYCTVHPYYTVLCIFGSLHIRLLYCTVYGWWSREGQRARLARRSSRVRRSHFVILQYYRHLRACEV